MSSRLHPSVVRQAVSAGRQSPLANPHEVWHVARMEHRATHAKNRIDPVRANLHSSRETSMINQKPSSLTSLFISFAAAAALVALTAQDASAQKKYDTGASDTEI